jgi:hypothetical protein
MLEKEKLSVFLSDMTGLRGPASHPIRVLAACRAMPFLAAFFLNFLLPKARLLWLVQGYPKH